MKDAEEILVQRVFFQRWAERENRYDPRVHPRRRLSIRCGERVGQPDRASRNLAASGSFYPLSRERCCHTDFVRLSRFPRGNVADRVTQHYPNGGGLPAPTPFREISVGAGEHSPIFGWVAEGTPSAQGQLVEMGLCKGIAVETIEGKIREANSAVELPVQGGAGARIRVARGGIFANTR